MPRTASVCNIFLTPSNAVPALQSDPLTGEVEGVFVTRQLSSDGAPGLFFKGGS